MADVPNSACIGLLLPIPHHSASGMAPNSVPRIPPIFPWLRELVVTQSTVAQAYSNRPSVTAGNGGVDKILTILCYRQTQTRVEGVQRSEPRSSGRSIIPLVSDIMETCDTDMLRVLPLYGIWGGHVLSIYSIQCKQYLACGKGRSSKQQVTTYIPLARQYTIVQVYRSRRGTVVVEMGM